MEKPKTLPGLARLIFVPKVLPSANGAEERESVTTYNRFHLSMGDEVKLNRII